MHKIGIAGVLRSEHICFILQVTLEVNTYALYQNELWASHKDFGAMEGSKGPVSQIRSDFNIFGD